MCVFFVIDRIYVLSSCVKDENLKIFNFEILLRRQILYFYLGENIEV